MKRLVAAFALLVTFSLSAAVEKLATLRLADTAGLVAAVSKIGMFIGNPMLVMPLTAGIAQQNPLQQVFGPGREGETTLLVVYGDAAEGALAPENLARAVRVAWLYPVAKGEADFRARYPKAPVTNGVYDLVSPRRGHVAFSADGAWATFADTAEAARLSLGEVAAAKRPLAGDVASLEVTGAGFAFVTGVLKASEEHLSRLGSDEASLRRLREMLSSLAAAKVAVRVDDAGLTQRVGVLPKAGSPWAKAFTEPLPAGDPFAFAGTGALYAFAYAPHGGIFDSTAYCSSESFRKDMEALAAKYGLGGLDLSFISSVTKGLATVVTLDFDAAVKFFRGPGKAAFEKVDPAAFMEDARAAFEKANASVPGEEPARSFAFALKGVDQKTTPGERFRRLAPEAAAKKPAAVGLYSFYALLYALAPKVVDLLPAEEREGVRPLLATLPPPGPGGFAVYGWREKNRLMVTLRVSPDEIKNLSVCLTTGASYMMMRNAASMQFEEEDAASPNPPQK